MGKALVREKARAIELRKKGLSYSAIKKEVSVSKSSLSLWLRNYPLTKDQIRELSWDNERRIERFRETFREKRKTALEDAYLEQSRVIGDLSKREIYLMGLMLYWGEGMKATRGTISFSNTNPKMMRMALYWLINSFNFSKEKIRVKLHLYSDMDVESETDYWSKEIGISKSQFRKPYIKESTLSGLTYKGFGHGTCNLSVDSVLEKNKIVMGMEVISDIFSQEYVTISGLKEGR